MKRSHFLILLLAVFVVAPGCSTQDPDQPAVGSISVGAKASDSDKPLVNKKSPKSFGNPR